MMTTGGRTRVATMDNEMKLYPLGRMRARLYPARLAKKTARTVLVTLMMTELYKYRSNGLLDENMSTKFSRVGRKTNLGFIEIISMGDLKLPITDHSMGNNEAVIAANIITPMNNSAILLLRKSFKKRCSFLSLCLPVDRATTRKSR